MKPPKFRLLATAAVLALATAASAHAAVIAQFKPVTNDVDYSWVQDGTGTGGTFSSVGTNGPAPGCTNCAAVSFSFLDPAAAALAFLPATLQFTGDVAPGTPAEVNGAGVWTQTGLDGSFNFTYYDSTKALGSTQSIGGFTLVNGVTNLLSGVFSGGWIQGSGGSGSTNETTMNGGSATFTSAILGPGHFSPGSEEFALNLLGVSPAFFASHGQSLRSFTANGGGNFSAVGVPEPAAWGLMILGFAGAGAMLRRRRALAAA
jgi:hypothetical protein